MPSRVTIRPLMRPMTTAAPMATRKASSKGMPASLMKVHMSTAEKPKTDPTERSNSPAVMSIVMPSAIMPSSGVNISRLLKLPAVRYVAESSEKVMRARMSSPNGPASGWVRARLRPSTTRAEVDRGLAAPAEASSLTLGPCPWCMGASAYLREREAGTAVTGLSMVLDEAPTRRRQ